MKKFIIFLILFLFSFVYLHTHLVAQQEAYIITANELQRLEVICQNWQVQKQKMLKEVNALNGKLQQALKSSKELQNSLKTETETLKSLRLSYNAYESETQNKITLLSEEIYKLKSKINQQRRTILIMIMLYICLIAYFKFILRK